MIPYGRQEITPEDVRAVVDTLQSDWITQGPAIDRFEEALAAYCGVSHAVAVCNATAALHLACAALDVGPGDIVWTSPNTFVASANCALYCGAKVDFVDIDPRSYNMSPDRLEEKLVAAENAAALPKVVIPVHFAGQSCDMRRIGELASRFGFKVIEDASHAVGGTYLGKPIGSCEHSDITVFSFHPVKIITTGEGGMTMTQHPELASRMARLRSHGITRDPSLMVGRPDGPWDYQQVELGFNYRMTDLQAALGLSQLARLDDYVARRHSLRRRYDELLAPLPVRLPWQACDAGSALHLYPIQVDQTRTEKRRLEVFEALRAAGVGVNVHYIPVHTQPHYQRLGYRRGDFPVAEAYYANAISLPMYPTLSVADQDFVVEALGEAFA